MRLETFETAGAAPVGVGSVEASTGQIAVNAAVGGRLSSTRTSSSEAWRTSWAGWLAWFAVLLTAMAMAFAFPFGGDAGVYERAATERGASGGIYLEGVERLQADHLLHRRMRTLNYIYPPATLPLVRAAGVLPRDVRIACFWLLYALGAFAVLRIEQAVLFRSRGQLWALLVPACLFFPGLLNDDYLLAGNVAPILYGLVALAALHAVRRGGQWGWFCLAVVFASLWKPPLLTLLVFAPLLKRGEWLRTVAAGVLGLGCFLLQRLVWPQPFGQYLRLMDLECLLNGEFGCSPAGELAKVLLRAGLPYKQPSTVFYGMYAGAVLLVLMRCGRQYLGGRLRLEQWLPVLLLGVVLLNPRIKQYDVAVATLPMAVLAWGALRRVLASRRSAGFAALLLFGVLNAVAGLLDAWDLLETILMAGLFGYAAVQLLRQPVGEVREAMVAA